VVAIGGSASVGKTTLAAELRERLGVDRDRVAHVDDLVPVVEAEGGPNFISTTPGVWRQPAAWLADELVGWTARLHPPIGALVAGMVETGGGGIVEGQGIEPRLSCQWDVAAVRTFYVIEPDPEALRRTFAQRASNAKFLALSDGERDGVVEMNRRYGQWLRRQAEAHGQLWLPARPWTTLADRVLAGLGV
jgi:2-phosphoglycerate kinase